MTLEDFEKSLAEESRETRDRERHHRDRDHRSSRHHRHQRRHSSRSRERGSGRREHESRHSDEHGHHRHKRSRHSTDHGDDRGHSHKRRHRHESKGDESAEAPAAVKEVVQEEPSRPKRDAWMEAPSALEVDYVNRRDSTRLQEEPKPKMLQADFELKIHNREMNTHLRDLQDGKALEDVEEPAQHEVDYTFGDAGSQWRMTRLRAAYREANETGKPVEEVAVDRFGDVRSFDDAREEEAELERRETYGEGYVGKTKPTGELFQERKLEQNIRRDSHQHVRSPGRELEAQGQGKPMETEPPSHTTQHLDLTALNRLKAQMMKAKLKGSADAADLEERYNTAAASMANRKESDVVVLGVMENRELAGKRNEVKPVETKRGRERGKVEENEDMSIEDMVREERRTGKQGDGRRLADRIAKDSKFEVSALLWGNVQTICSNGVPRMIWNIWTTTLPNWLDECIGLRSTSKIPPSTISKR